MLQTPPAPNGALTPIQATSIADACKQLPTSALGNVILKALVGEAERSVAVEALAELLARLRSTPAAEGGRASPEVKRMREREHANG